MPGYFKETAGVKPEEGGDDVKSSWPLCPGPQTCHNGRYKGSKTERWSKPQKADLSPDWGLQLAPMKLESLVIADQLRRGECVPEPCTHRPSSHPSRAHPKSLAQPFGGGGAEGEFCEGD